jgi:hypothetical protein
MDFNLQIIPHIDTVVIWMSKPPLPTCLGSLNDVSRMQDEAQWDSFSGPRPRQQFRRVIGIKAQVVVIVRVGVI